MANHLTGFFVVALVGGDQARERGRHLRPERHLPFAFIGEIVELADNFLAAF